MIEMVTSWLLFPLVLAVASIGIGAGLARVAQMDAKDYVATRLPLGLAGLIVVSQLLTWGVQGAWPQRVLLILVLIVGSCAVVRTLQRGGDWPAVGVGVVAFAAYAGPVVLSGT